MAEETSGSELDRGYLSAESKRQFTLVAGVLGTVFFLAQFVLPIVVMFAVMFPMMTRQSIATADFAHATLWKGELWYVENAMKLDWRARGSHSPVRWLKHARLADLAESPNAARLDDTGEESTSSADFPELLAENGRLWVIGEESASVLEGDSLTRFAHVSKPARASRPFLYRGRPAVVTRGRSPQLAVLEVDGTSAGASATWRSEPIALETLPADGSIRKLEVLQAGGREQLVAELCVEEARGCSLFQRELRGTEWIRLADEGTCCRRWTAIALAEAPAVVVSEQAKSGGTRFALLSASADGVRRTELPTIESRFGWDSQAISSGSRLFLLAQGMPGSRRLVEVVDGEAVRTVSVKGSFPFGAGMMGWMFLPQLLPMVLSMLLAFLLSAQMHRHRVETYVVNGVERRFASLWQRAWAQLVDALVLALGPLVPFLWFVRKFADPESLTDADGFSFVLSFFGLFALALLWVLLALAVFSYLEGRYGKTPGKWLLHIRVVGTELEPCGFWRALVRNLLTFVDGFFNFLVGVLLVALTENWQRLGDLAARTLVIVDEPAGAPPRSAPAAE